MTAEKILYTSSITETDDFEMSKAYTEAYAIGIATEQDRLAYVDLKTHPHNHTCSICGEEYFGWGHNAKPVVEDARCCAKCNAEVVIPARLGEDNASDVMVFSSMEELNAFAQDHEVEFNPHGWGAEAA